MEHGETNNNVHVTVQNSPQLPLLEEQELKQLTEPLPKSFQEDEQDEELRKLLIPDVRDLPLAPPSAVETNFVSYFAPDFIKEGHDQYVYRHANGLCVIGLAPTHIAFKDSGGVTAVDFNVGKSDRSSFKVTGKRKKNAQFFEPNSALCKVCTKDNSYIVRCSVKGSLLEVNDRLIKQPELLNTVAHREGYIAIVMPKAADWLKVKESLLNLEEYKRLREVYLQHILRDCRVIIIHSILVKSLVLDENNVCIIGIRQLGGWIRLH